MTYFENCFVYEIMWKKYCRIRQVTDDNIIRRTRFSGWIPKTINTHSEYVILNAFQLQQWLHERASMLRYTYVACLVSFQNRKFEALKVGGG